MKHIRAWLRAFLGIEDHEQAIQALTPIAVSVHRRLSHYEATVPAIQKIARATQARHLRDAKKGDLGESASGDVA